MSGNVASLTIDGETFPLRSWTMSVGSSDAPRSAPPIAYGAREISGTITCVFENTALMEEYCRRDVELANYLRLVLAKPHKASIWHKLRPFLARLGVLTALLLASMALATGVG